MAKLNMEHTYIVISMSNEKKFLAAPVEENLEVPRFLKN